MSEKDQICNYCLDVIHSVKDDTVRIQRGYFNVYKEFISVGEGKVRHARCHNLIEARALIMGDITAQLQITDFSKKVRSILDKLEG